MGQQSSTITVDSSKPLLTVQGEGEKEEKSALFVVL